MKFFYLIFLILLITTADASLPFLANPYIYNCTNSPNNRFLFSTKGCSGLYDNSLTSPNVSDFNSSTSVPYVDMVFNMNTTAYMLNNLSMSVCTRTGTGSCLHPENISIIINGEEFKIYHFNKSSTLSGSCTPLNQSFINSSTKIDIPGGFQSFTIRQTSGEQGACSFRSEINEASVYLTDYSVSNNRLPLVNLTCRETGNFLDPAIGYIDVPVSVNASDQENDTILYSYKLQSFTFQEILYSDEFSVNNLIDYGVFNRGILLSNDSFPTNDQENNDMYDNSLLLDEFKGVFGNVEGDTGITFTNRADDWQYRSPVPIKGNGSISNSFIFLSDHQELTFTYLDSNQDKIMNLTFNETDGVLKIYKNGVLNLTTSHIDWDETHTSYFILTTGLYPGDSVINYIDLGNETFTLKTSWSGTDFQGIKVHNQFRDLELGEQVAPSYFIGRISISGYNYVRDITWDEVSPDILRFNKTGIYSFLLLTTDDIHQDLSYNESRCYITISNQDGLGSSSQYDQKGSSGISGINFFEFAFFDPAVKAKFYSIAWLAEVLLLLGMLYATRQIMIAVIIVSAIYIFIFFLGLTSIPQFFVNIVLIALMIAGSMAGLTSGRGMRG